MQRKPWKPRSRLRRIARRSAVVWWVAALGLGVVTTSVTSSAIRRSTNEAAGWGTRLPVWVLTRTVAAGEVIGRADVRRQQLPRRVIPAGALPASSSPIGDAARVGLVPGEVVLGQRLAREGAHGVAAMVAPGRRAVAMKNDESMPSVRPGDRVDVIATFDVVDDTGGQASGAAPSFPVAANAEVLAVSARTITISVAGAEASRVAFALARAAVTLALRGGGPASERALSQ